MNNNEQSAKTGATTKGNVPQGNSGISSQTAASLSPEVPKTRAEFIGELPTNFTSPVGLAWPMPGEPGYYFFQPDGTYDVHTVRTHELKLETPPTGEGIAL